MKDLVKVLRTHWDRASAVALVLAGVVAVTVGWVAVSDTILTFEQIPYVMSGGLAGVCLVAIGASLWLSADIRDEWRKLDRLEEAVRGLNSREVDATDEAVSERPPSAPRSEPRRLRLTAEG